MGGKGNSKGSDVPKTWADVKDKTLKQLESRLEDVDTAIAQNDVLSNFKCELTKFKGVQLQTIVRKHPYEMQRAFWNMGPKSKYEAAKGQDHLAIHVYRLLQLMDIDCKYVPKEIKDQAGDAPELPPAEDWTIVQNKALGEVHPRLDEAVGIVEGDPDLLGFKCQLKEFPFDLATMLKQYPVRIDTAFYAHRPGRTAPPTASQKHLVDAMCKLLQTMGIAVPDHLAVDPAVSAVPTDADLTARRDEGKRGIYIIFVDDSFYFKLGTHKLQKKAFNPDGPCILDRYSNRPTPPSGMPPDTIWEMERLSLCTWVYTREELGEAPDHAIHDALRKLATELSIPLAPKGEFHHMGMLCEAVKMVRATGIDALPKDMEQTDPESDNDVDLAAALQEALGQAATDPYLQVAPSSEASSSSLPAVPPMVINIQSIVVKTGKRGNRGVVNASIASFCKKVRRD